MKRVLSILLAVLCILSVACSPKEVEEVIKSDAVINAENAIEAIGNVTLDSNEDISKAESAYGFLTENEKEQVGNRMDLFYAMQSYKAIVEANKQEQSDTSKQSDTPKTFSIRHGISFGMHLDEVKEIESKNGHTVEPVINEDRSKLFYEDDTVFDRSTDLTFNFSKENELVTVFYTFTNYRVASSSFLAFNDNLKEKYGAPDYTMATGASSNLVSRIGTGTNTYSQWVESYDDYIVVISLYIDYTDTCKLVYEKVPYSKMDAMLEKHQAVIDML